MTLARDRVEAADEVRPGTEIAGTRDLVRNLAGIRLRRSRGSVLGEVRTLPLLAL